MHRLHGGGRAQAVFTPDSKSLVVAAVSTAPRVLGLRHYNSRPSKLLLVPVPPPPAPAPAAGAGAADAKAVKADKGQSG
jgi:hypothetical protein